MGTRSELISMTHKTGAEVRWQYRPCPPSNSDMNTPLELLDDRKARQFSSPQTRANHTLFEDRKQPAR